MASVFWGSSLATLSKREKVRSSGLVEPTLGGREREDKASCTFGRRGGPVVKFPHFQRTLRSQDLARVCAVTRTTISAQKRDGSCCQLRVRPVAFGSKLGHCPVAISLVRSLLFTVSASGAMATRTVLGGLGTRKRSHGCAGAATPETLGPSRSANGQDRVGHVT